MLVTLAFSIPGGAAFVALIESGLNFLANATHSAGLAIIIFTIAVRTVMLPLGIKQAQSQKAMARLQPELREIQKKHAGDRTKRHHRWRVRREYRGVGVVFQRRSGPDARRRAERYSAQPHRRPEPAAS